MRLPDFVRHLALRCALLPVPRAARARIADELEEEYPSVRRQRGKWAARTWYGCELGSIFGWYVLQRLPSAALIGNIGRDARGALRGMRVSAGFTTLAVLVLALGIGANAAVFSIFDWVMLSDPPGVTRADRLVTLRFGSDGSIFSVGHPLHVELRERNQALSGLTAYASISAHVALPGEAHTERVPAELVTETFFDVLGVTMPQGRGFRPEEGEEGSSARVAVISARAAAQWFGRADAVGGEIVVNGTPFEVVGVAPAGFHGPEHPGDTELWVPIGSHDASVPQWPDVFERSGGVWLHMVGRLGEGATVDTARAELAALVQQVADEFGDDGGGFRRFDVVVTEGTGTFGLRDRALTTLRIMSMVVGALLLLTCANVANMVLARATGRQREIAVRRALGATRPRLVAQLLVESTMLAALGGIAAVFVAFAIVRSLEGAHVVSWMPGLRDVPVDLGVLGFAFGVSLLTGVAFGLAPALTASRPASLRRGASPGGRLRDGLVIAQLALSLMLFVGAALLAQTLGNLRSLDLGIERGNLAFFSIDPALQGYDEARSTTLLRRVAEDLARLPAVSSVSMGYPEAFGRMRAGAMVALWGEDVEEKGLRAESLQVTPDYFETMGIELVEGGTFDGDLMSEREPARPRVILSERLARRMFPEGPAVGRQLALQDRREPPVPYEIVGVARDARLWRPSNDEVDIVYEPFGQRYFPHLISFQVRARADADSILGQVRETMLSADPTLPAFDVVTAVDKIDGTIADYRLVAGLSSALAGLALLLAGVGIYGVVSTGVRMRFHEIGVRMALGADARKVIGNVLRGSLVLAGVGVALGWAGAYQAAGLLRSRLYGVEPFDLTTFAAAAVAMLLVTLLASLMPARRATRVSPVEVLRRD